MTDPFEPPPDAHHVTVRNAEGFIWQVSPDIVLQKAGGILSGPLMQYFLDFFEPILRPGARIRIFADFARLTHYTTEGRELATAFTIDRRSALDSIHILGESKYLALAFGSFRDNVGADRVFVYSDRESFLRSFDQAMKQGPSRLDAAQGIT
jgi:hypothetical protein